MARHLRKMSDDPNDICSHCAEHAGPCTNDPEKKYFNCYNRQHCQRLEKATPGELLQDIVDSNCLSCNYTPESRRIVEEHLREAIDFLDMKYDGV